MGIYPYCKGGLPLPKGGLVIGAWNLELVCILEFGYWDLFTRHASEALPAGFDIRISCFEFFILITYPIILPLDFSHQIGFNGYKW